MAWLLLTVTSVLAVLVGLLALRVRRLDAQLARVLAPGPASGPASDPASGPAASASRGDGPATDDPVAEFVITRVGQAAPEEGATPSATAPAPTLSAPVFADLVLRESVVQTASLFQGLRRALTPETRNRIRFHVRAEVKRSRKQRRAELREVRREWAARQRATMAAAEDSAA